MADHAGALAPPRRRAALLRGRRGVTTVVFALSLTALLGALGVGTEAAFWYEDWVQVQGVADAAAMSGAVSISVPAEQQTIASNPNAPETTMTYVAGQNGYVNGTGGVTITPHYPPADGSYASNEYAAEITISKQETLHIARLFMSVGPTITGKAVALYSANKGTCMLALGKASGAGGNGRLTMSGSSSLDAAGCSVADNGTASSAVSLSGSSHINAYTVQSSGGISLSGSASLTVTKPDSANTVPTVDPLVAVQSVTLPGSSDFPTSGCPSGTPTGAGCWSGISVSGSNTLTLSGGTYQFTTGGINLSGSSSLSFVNPTSAGSIFYINGGITVSGSATLNILPGTYFLNSSSLTVSGSAQLMCGACVAGGAGVTFVLMGSGTVNISGSGQVTLSAPASNNYASGLDGVAIYEIPTDTGSNTLSGSDNLTVQGAVYMPGAALTTSGSSATSAPTCSVFVANTITVSGSASATDQQCASYGYSWAGSATPSGVSLVQ